MYYQFTNIYLYVYVVKYMQLFIIVGVFVLFFVFFFINGDNPIRILSGHMLFIVWRLADQEEKKIMVLK